MLNTLETSSWGTFDEGWRFALSWVWSSAYGVAVSFVLKMCQPLLTECGELEGNSPRSMFCGILRWAASHSMIIYFARICSRRKLIITNSAWRLAARLATKHDSRLQENITRVVGTFHALAKCIRSADATPYWVTYRPTTTALSTMVVMGLYFTQYVVSLMASIHHIMSRLWYVLIILWSISIAHTVVAHLGEGRLYVESTPVSRENSINGPTTEVPTIFSKLTIGGSGRIIRCDVNIIWYNVWGQFTTWDGIKFLRNL